MGVCPRDVRSRTRLRSSRRGSGRSSVADRSHRRAHGEERDDGDRDPLARLRRERGGGPAEEVDAERATQRVQDDHESDDGDDGLYRGRQQPSSGCRCGLIRSIGRRPRLSSAVSGSVAIGLSWHGWSPVSSESAVGIYYSVRIRRDARAAANRCRFRRFASAVRDAYRIWGRVRPAGPAIQRRQVQRSSPVCVTLSSMRSKPRSTSPSSTLHSSQTYSRADSRSGSSSVSNS